MDLTALTDIKAKSNLVTCGDADLAGESSAVDPLRTEAGFWASFDCSHESKSSQAVARWVDVAKATPCA